MNQNYKETTLDTATLLGIMKLSPEQLYDLATYGLASMGNDIFLMVPVTDAELAELEAGDEEPGFSSNYWGTL